MVQTRDNLAELPIHHKILRVMYELGRGKSKRLSLEKITATAFERFPVEFCMEGYPQYPDSMKVSKRLYSTLKPDGLVRSADAKFELTELGIDTAKRLLNSTARKSQRLPRSLARELNRILSGQAFALFANGKKEQILDSDFYAYLGASVRTPYNELKGRIASVEAAVARLKTSNPNAVTSADLLIDLHGFLLKKFSKDLEIRRSL